MDEQLNLALVQHEQGLLNDAVVAYQDYIQNHPESAEAYRLLGIAQYQLQQLSQAEATLSQALDLNAEDARIYNALSLVSRALGKTEIAEELLIQSIKIDESMHESHNNLGILYHQQNKLTAAESEFKRALELKPQSVAILTNLGHLYRDNHLYEQATTIYRQTVGLEPENPRNLINLAYVCMEKGEKEQAIKYYGQAQELDPKNATVTHMINALKGTQTAHPPQDYVQELFDYYADNFDASLNALGYNAPERIRNIIDHYPQINLKGKKVIDLGCGTGACAKALNGLEAELYGIDLSPRMVDIARSTGLYQEVVMADINTALSALGEAVDVILGADLVIYVGALEELFGLSADKLKKGGLFILTVEEDTTETQGYKLQPSGRFTQTVDYMEDMCKRFGFGIIEAQEFPLRQQGEKTLPGKLYLMQRS